MRVDQFEPHNFRQFSTEQCIVWTVSCEIYMKYQMPDGLKTFQFDTTRSLTTLGAWLDYYSFIILQMYVLHT